MSLRVARGAILVAPFAAALLVGGVVLLLTGRNPFDTYGLLVAQSWGSWSGIVNSLAQATPILLTGLATAFAFRAGVFTVGVEGSLYVGAFAGAWVGFTLGGLPGFGLIGLAFLAAALAGGAWGLLPGILRARWRVDEIVTTLMLNFVAISLTSYLVNGPFLAVGTANSMSPTVAPDARLGSLAPPSQLNAGFLIALLLAGLFWFVTSRTTIGYRLDLGGSSPRFAAASGVDLKRVILVGMVVAGCIGGLAGAIQVLGVNGRFIDRFSPGFGFTGIAVALLGRNTAIGCVVAALFFGGLNNGAAMMQLFSDIPLDLVNVLSGTVMIFAVLDFARIRVLRRAAVTPTVIAPSESPAIGPASRS